MTPGARVAAAIEVLNHINGGAPAEQALTAWTRGSRFAGSKDRAAVRDHVYDVLRARRSLGDGDGRSLMIRLALRQGWDMAALFSGEGHAPVQLTDEEHASLNAPRDLSSAARCDIPDWLWPHWQDGLGGHAEQAAISQQGRADVFLRVNTRRASVAEAVSALIEDDVETQEHASASNALRVTRNPRRVKNTRAFGEGLVELQDASSQFAVNAVPVRDGARLLDYCAGGGGKALGFADVTHASIFAHDIAPARMRDLPSRAERAGVSIQMIQSDDLEKHAPFDVIFCDAPCSGSGTWRRTPDAKWRLTADRLMALQQAQDDVLRSASKLVASDGLLAYATCSVLKCENDEAIARFIATHSEWAVTQTLQLLPDVNGDGFFLCLLKQSKYNL